MEKADLLEYLKAVCEAEEAAYACEEATKVFTEEMQNNNRIKNCPNLPVKYVHSVYFDFLEEILESGGTAILGGVLGLILIVVVSLDTELPSIGATIISMLIGAVVAVTIKIMVMYSTEKSRKASEAENEYQSAMVQYEKDKAAYDTQIQLAEVISSAIRENEDTYARIQATLKKLYDAGILYSTFQNTIAVHQIRQYLEMGLCDALDGPTGAYAEYMKDVRTQRICDSIQDMKHAVLGALNQIAANQQLLYREMQQVNENIGSLRRSMESGLQAIQGEIAKTRNAVDTRLNTSVNKQMDEMRRILLTSAQNQYIVQREQFANDWWNRNRLQQP